MSRLNNLYVQSLTAQLPPQDTADMASLNAKISRLADQLCQADAVVVGIGSGLSSSAGYDFYHGGEWFDTPFSQYRRAHGFETMFDGMYHVFGTNEEQWAFNAAAARHLQVLPTGEPYLQLAKILEGTEHFVITTNVDGQARKAFGGERLFLFQGDLGYWQCSQPCCEDVVSNVRLAEDIVNVTEIGRSGVPKVPYDMLPRCAKCGRLMAPWIRDINFLEGQLWHEQEERYINFLRSHLVSKRDKVLFLELGVSSMTPAIIKMPFWSMCEKNSQTEYVCVNMGEASTPAHLGERASVITADLAVVIEKLADAPGQYDSNQKHHAVCK